MTPGASRPDARRTPAGRRFRVGALIAAIFLPILSFFAIAGAWPPLTGELALIVRFPQGTAGKIEPIITTGRYGAGDLIVFRYHSANEGAFAYDHWGASGPASTRVTFIPGVDHKVVIQMPSLPAAYGEEGRGTVRVTFDGKVVLQETVPFHPWRGKQVYFGANGIGGTSEPKFRGKLLSPSGRPVSGSPASYFSLAQRAGAFFSSPRLLLNTLVASLLAGLLLPLLGELASHVTARSAAAGASRPPHTAFAATALAAAIAFTAVITAGTLRLIYPESFGTFYDYQAASLLAGRLDVPEAALGSEAFWYAGKCYGYFGPTPALLRLPFVAMGLWFGELSRLYMVMSFAAALGAAYALQCLVTQLRHGPGAWPTRPATVLFISTVAGGSTLFFLGSRAYIYHEAIVTGAAFALWGTYFSLRYLGTRAWRWGIAALLCGLLALHSRPPMGLFAFGVVGIAAAFHFSRAVVCRWRTAACPPDGAGPRGSKWLTHFAIGLASVAGVLSFNGLGYLKFKTFDGCPIRYNVQYHAERLERIDGRKMHAGNLRFGVHAYLLEAKPAFQPLFPFLRVGDIDPARYPEAKVDLAENITSIPYAMPALTLLAVLGLAAVACGDRATRPAGVMLCVGAAPLFLTMFAAVAVSHRYTADFLPFLIPLAALGLAAVDGASGGVARLVRWIAGGLTVLSIVSTVAITLWYQGERVWGVPDETHKAYRELQQNVDRLLRRPAP